MRFSKSRGSCARMALVFVTMFIVITNARAVLTVAWNDPVTVDPPNGSAPPYYGKVAYSDGYTHLIWQRTTSPTGTLLYARSSDNGTTWGTSRTLASSIQMYEYRISAEGNTVVVAYAEVSGSQRIVHAMRSTDFGVTWEAAQTLAVFTTNYAGVKDIEVSGDTVAVVWTTVDGSNYAVYSAVSRNAGVSWDAAHLVHSVAGGGMSAPADLAIVGNTLVVVRSTANAAVALRSQDWGATWSSPVTVGTATSNELDLRSVESSGQTVITYWTVGHGSGVYQMELFVARSADGGATWNTPVEISSVFSGVNIGGALAFRAGTAIIVWNQTAAANQPYYLAYATSSDEGATWDVGPLTEETGGGTQSRSRRHTYSSEGATVAQVVLFTRAPASCRRRSKCPSSHRTPLDSQVEPSRFRSRSAT